MERRKSSSLSRRRASHLGERVKVHVRVRPLLPSDTLRDGEHPDEPESDEFASADADAACSSTSLSAAGSVSNAPPLFRPQSRGKVNVAAAHAKGGEIKSFQFDAFFDEATTQEEVYDLSLIHI